MQYLPQNTCKTSFFQIIVFYRSKLAVNALLATKVQILQFYMGQNLSALMGHFQAMLNLSSLMGDLCLCQSLIPDGAFSSHAKSLIPAGGFVLVPNLSSLMGHFQAMLNPSFLMGDLSLCQISHP